MFTVSVQPAVTPELCQALSTAADELARGSRVQVAEEAIESFVQLGWMERRGETLCVTTLGRMARLQARARSLRAARVGVGLDEASAWPGA